jgi:hypothetical protein
MVAIEQYIELFFNKETGKERYGLIPKEAENMYKNNSLEENWKIAMECYDNELYYRVVQKLQFLNNFRLKTAKCRAFCKTCSITNRVIEQVLYTNVWSIYYWINWK